MLTVLLLAGAVPFLPQGEGEVAPRFPAAVETEASKIFNSAMSPFCPGLTIANCPSPDAKELRETIREQLAAGMPRDSVEKLFYAAYGDEYRGTPPTSGLGLVAWVVPGLGLVVGAIGLVWWLRRRGRPQEGAAAATPGLDADAEARLERELAEL
jgi:cytochrome c-type biogenesis protein CcmH